MNLVRGNIITAAMVVFLLAVAALYASAIPSRTIHIDEGMGIRASERALSGDLTYNPKNGHGPTLFYMGAMVRRFAGPDLAAFRALTAVSALMSIVVLWFIYRRRLNTAGQIVLLIGLGLSSGMVFYGTYFIHEMVMIMFSVLALSSVELWIRTKKGIWIAVTIVALSLMVMTKETAFFIYAAWATGIFAVILFRTGSHPFTGAFTRRNLIFAFYGFLAAVFLYMAMFGASLDLFRSPFFWLERGMTMHIKPWYYFFTLALLHEPFIFVFGIVMAAYASLKKIWDPRMIFFLSWFAVLMTVHSSVPYKTPWLLPYMLLPLALFAAFAVSSVWERTDKKLLSILIAFLAISSLVPLIKDNFISPDRRSEYSYAYLQSGKGLREMMSIIEAVASQYDGRLPMQIVGRGDELLYVITERYDREYGQVKLGLPLYINYKHDARDTKDFLALSGYEYVFLKFTYIDPLPEIDLFVREDMWERYKRRSGSRSPQEIRSDGVLRYH